MHVLAVHARTAFTSAPTPTREEDGFTVLTPNAPFSPARTRDALRRQRLADLFFNLEMFEKEKMPLSYFCNMCCIGALVCNTMQRNRGLRLLHRKRGGRLTKFCFVRVPLHNFCMRHAMLGKCLRSCSSAQCATCPVKKLYFSKFLYFSFWFALNLIDSNCYVSYYHMIVCTKFQICVLKNGTYHRRKEYRLQLLWYYAPWDYTFWQLNL